MTMDYPGLLVAVDQSHERVRHAISTLTTQQMREDSALPGWSRGHVATHLARNADALNRLAEGVLAGDTPEMYPGGPPARDAAIAEGAGRPTELISADFSFASRRVLDSLSAISTELLGTPVNWRLPITARDLVSMRWSELEIHHLDLNVGYTVADWPENFVVSTLHAQLQALARSSANAVVPELPATELLAWLVGRPTRPDLPQLPPWPF
ncbi:maleylpyruvate isomerase family mycothiol-dependent enzyme [Jatrophihabitans sp. DSM 45814]